MLHKSKDFSTNISNIFKTTTKVSIQKVISLGWVQIQKGKLCGRTLKTFQVQDKPNLHNIFKSYLGYHDLESLCNSPNSFERFQKKLFTMIKQLGPPTFFLNLRLLKDHGILSLKLCTHYMFQNEIS